MKTKIHQIVTLATLAIMLCLPMASHGFTKTRTGTITRTASATKRTTIRTSTKTRTGTKSKTFTATGKGENTISERTIAAKKSQHVIAILASSPVKGISHAAKKAQEKTPKAKIKDGADALRETLKTL